MKLNAAGTLAHHFYGDYSAGIGLEFSTAEDCLLALPHLGPRKLEVAWWQNPKHPKVATILVNSDQLAVIKEHLGTLGADTKAIDSMAHSIDYGDPFAITVEIEDPKQLHLLSV